MSSEAESYRSDSNTQSRASNFDENDCFKKMDQRMGTANFGNDQFNPFLQEFYNESSKNRQSVTNSSNPFGNNNRVEEDL